MPNPDVRRIKPVPNGDGLIHTVDKFWTVLAPHEDDMLSVVTGGGSTHIIDAADPNLRHANWWEWLFLRWRFPDIDRSDCTQSAMISR